MTTDWFVVAADVDGGDGGNRVSAAPGNTGNTGNLLEFYSPPGNIGKRPEIKLVLLENFYDEAT